MDTAMRRIASMRKIYICGLVLLLLNVAQGFAQQEADFEWEADDYGFVIITNYSGTIREVTIPAEINGMLVVGIDRSAFAGKYLASVTIPDGIAFIQKGAFFENCLTSVTIPGSVIDLMAGAFESNRLTSITISPGVRRIESNTFPGNPITSITIGADVEFVPEGRVLDSILGILSDDGFDRAYIDGGKLAGTYTRPDAESTTWTRQ
jgi:hypothetical protein